MKIIRKKIKELKRDRTLKKLMKRDIELEIQLTELKFKIEGEDRKAKAEKELLYLEIPNLNHLVQDQLETIAKDIKCIKSNDLDKIIEDQDFRYTQ